MQYRNNTIVKILTLILTVILAVVIAVAAAGCAAPDDEQSPSGDGQAASDASEDPAVSEEQHITGLEEIADTSQDFAILIDEAVGDVIYPPIKKEEVYRIKPGTRITKDDLRKYGGASRYFQVYKIKEGDRVYKRIIGKSYRENPNIGLQDLRYIKTLYWDFDGKTRSGEIIVNQSIAKDTKEVFRELYRKKYQIRKMLLIDEYYTEGGAGTDADNASMNDDNTSAFNYRTVAGTNTISRHGYGLAIDVNPFENPWCPGGKVYPNQKASAEYADRSTVRPHMIFSDSDITKIFKKHGFRWLGETSTRDYQHFEK